MEPPCPGQRSCALPIVDVQIACLPADARIISKVTQPEVDAYSGVGGTGLKLRQPGVDRFVAARARRRRPSIALLTTQAKETAMNSRSLPAGFKPVRRDELRQEREHDSYKLRQKPPEPAACPDCGAFYHGGRWQWGLQPSGSHPVVCPACHRIRDRYPAGYVHIGGQFFGTHRDELLSLVRHHEARAKAEHPLVRIMTVADDADGVLVTTTDIHLARDLGDALHHAYQGQLEFHYNDAENLLRVDWRR